MESPGWPKPAFNIIREISNQITLPFVFLLTSLFIIGCGNESEEDAGEIVPSFPESVSISSDNANEIIVAVIGESLLHFSILDLLVSDLRIPSGDCSVEGEVLIETFFLTETGRAQQGSSISKQYQGRDIDPDQGRNINPATGIETSNEDQKCEFESGSIEGDVDIFFADASGEIRVNSDDGSVTFIDEAEALLEIEVDSFDFTNNIPLQNLQVEGATDSTFIQTLEDVEDRSEGRQFSSSLDGSSTRFDLFNLFLNQDNNNGRYLLTVDTKLTTDEIGGTVTVLDNSDTPLEGSFVNVGSVPVYSPPDAGRFIVIGFDDSLLAVTVLDAINVDIRIDTDGDGDFDVFDSRTWFEIGLDVDVSLF